jgi:hypothetical protein
VPSRPSSNTEHRSSPDWPSISRRIVESVGRVSRPALHRGEAAPEGAASLGREPGRHATARQPVPRLLRG